MVFRTGPHIERTQEHLASDDAHRLRYACLELRFALERIAYQKLQLRLPEISMAEIAAWQPKRVMDALMELVDPHLDQDATLSMGSPADEADPVTDTYTPLGTNKGVDSKKLGEHWHKLGFYLHMSAPQEKGEQPSEPDADKLRVFIEEVIAYVEEMTSTGFDFHFSEKVSFECGACGQTIVRNARLLKDGDIIQCRNPVCDASYRTQMEGEQFLFNPYQLTIECKSCERTMYINANKLLDLPYDRASAVRCECGARHQVVWGLQYALISEEGRRKSKE